jgi:hypothetical protein
MVVRDTFVPALLLGLLNGFAFVLGCGEGHGPTLNGVEARQDYAIGLMALPRPDNPGLVVIFFSADRRPRRLQFCQREP